MSMIFWMGRIYATKMTFSPNSCTLCVLTVSVPPHLLRSSQCQILKFVWGLTRQSSNQAVLYKQKCAGGLVVTNLTHYYKATQIAPLIHLYAGESAPLWTYIDLVDVDPVPLQSLLWLPAQFCPKPLNPFCLIHSQYGTRLKILQGYFHLEVFNCPWFPPGLDDPHSFHWWSSKSLITVHSFLTTRGVYTFQQLQETYRYIQIHHFLDSLVRNDDSSCTSTAFETRCHTHPTTQGLVSLLYSLLLRASYTQAPCYCARWESDFGALQSPEDWCMM